MSPVKVWIVHLSTALLLEITYEQIRTQVIGYTREEHLRYTRLAVATVLPANRSPISIASAGPSPHFSRN